LALKELPLRTFASYLVLSYLHCAISALETVGELDCLGSNLSDDEQNADSVVTGGHSKPNIFIDRSFVLIG
jgi:hypothetical protein